jgi:parallel beta-helix repeat protein
MKRVRNLILGLAIALFLLIALGVQFISGVSPDRRQVAPLVASQSLGRTRVVTSTADSGPGTLRQALLDAQGGDTITFDPAVFPPTSSMTITLTSGLPDISQGNLTIDGSNAGVILDGSNIGTMLETLLLDDFRLTLDGGPNLIANGDFSAGLGHWRPWPWEEGPGMIRSLNSSDFHSSSHSYQWSSVAHAGDGRTVYDRSDTSDPFDSDPYYPGSTVWMSVTGGSTAELRFWYKSGPVHVALLALFPDGHVEQIGDRWFGRAAPWTQAVASQIVPANAVGVALELGYGHSERYTNGFLISSNGNTIQGLQIVRFPSAGVGLSGGAQNNVIGGDRNVGAGPLGQGNLISGNASFGIGLWDADTSFNTIRGNHIGTDLSGARVWGGRRDGIHSNGANYNLVVDNLISGYGTGVYLCCVSDGHNTVSGNYIGTDASGGAGVGNRGVGVALDRSGYNVVAANVIAYNGGPGIAVYGTDSVRNRITQNSIHDNGGPGIDLWDGGNTELAAPLIFDFDLNAGTVSGNACTNCTVEVFSDSNDEGEVYEGQTVADSAGVFSFNKGAPFTGSHLTATATDADGDTSEFSAPTSGTRRSMILQEGNNLPKTLIVTKRSRELADNHIGGDYGSDISDSYDGFFELGLKWGRLAFDGKGSSLNWQRVETEPGEYTINPVEDVAITDVVNNGVNIVLNLGVGPGDGITGTRFVTEEEIERYLNYVRFMVQHFKGRVRYYELWNEPGGTNPETGEPSPIGISVNIYANVITRAVPIIRQADPEAKIVIGALGGDWISGFPGYGEYSRSILHIEYLRHLITSGVAPLVDAISWHPFYGNRPDDPYYQTYPDFVKEIKELAASQGFRGEYFAEEIKYYTEPAFEGGWPPVVTEKVAAKYYARAIVMHLGLDFTVSTAGQPGYGGLVPDIIRALCTVMAAASPISLPIEIQSEATNIRTHGFSLSDGGHLVALWTDGIGVDDDPGISATLTIPGFSGQTATGIDVLYGFEQKLITSSEGNNMVIHGLLVKDYPIILRLAPTKYVFLPIVLKGYTH